MERKLKVNAFSIFQLNGLQNIKIDVTLIISLYYDCQDLTKFIDNTLNLTMH